MAKNAAKSKIEIIEVKTSKVDQTIKLDEIIDQLAKKAQAASPKKGARAAGASGERQDRVTRIKELSAQLAQELRALKQSPAADGKAPAASRKKSN